MLKLNLQYFHHWCKELTHLKRPWCWERLKAGGEGDNRGWDGWMASLTRWRWVWVNSGSWWWTGRPGVLQSIVSQRVGHNWVTELNWTELLYVRNSFEFSTCINSLLTAALWGGFCSVPVLHLTEAEVEKLTWQFAFYRDWMVDCVFKCHVLTVEPMLSWLYFLCHTVCLLEGPPYSITCFLSPDHFLLPWWFSG